jgi:acyl-CoA reductase-like NAD-dependent aldehyde dehydrogenase
MRLEDEPDDPRFSSGDLIVFKLLIGGELIDTQARRAVVNPVDETIAAQVPDADTATMNAAIAAAARAYQSWRVSSYTQRREVVLAMSKAVTDHGEELAKLLVLETGRPMGVAQFEVGLAKQFLDYYAEQQLEVEVMGEDAARRVELHRKPLGVVAAIVPWNAPLYLAANKIAPALMAGNTIVVKPAPTTPLTTLRFGELIAKLVPPGVVNIVTGSNEVSAHLVGHRDITKVAFTGSTHTGRAIMAASAPSLKRLTLELGGNDAAIVLSDANVKAIAPALFGLAFFNSGQVCAVIKRLYVHDSIYDAVCDEIAALARDAMVGDGSDPATQFGPIQNRAQYEKVLGFLDDARAHGKIIAGGERRQGPGFFVPLTVVRDIADGTSTVDDEPFGPILPIIRYSNVDDAVARANRSPYGLGASVWSSDSERAAAVARRLESGTVWVNQHCALDPAVPFPAHKQSGLGVEGGREGLFAYTALQVVNISKG